MLASGSRRGAPTAAIVLEWKLDSKMRGGKTLSVQAIIVTSQITDRIERLLSEDFGWEA